MPDEASEMPAKACDQAKKLTLKGNKNTHSILMFLPELGPITQNHFNYNYNYFEISTSNTITITPS